MLKIIKRISRLLALVVVYVICAYGYLTAKGFVFTDGVPVLSNHAQAKEEEFAVKVNGNVKISGAQLRARGVDDAPLMMYAFSSMACSHCSDFHRYILPKLERDFISTGKLRYIFVHFPIDAVSMRAAKLSYCLPADKYDDFISELYKKKDWLLSGKNETLNKYAREFGMTDETIKICDDNKKLTSDILLTFNDAIKTFGIQGTPSFIIEGADGREMVSGSRGYDEFRDYLNSRLEKVKK